MIDDEQVVEGFLGISEDGRYVHLRKVSGHLQDRELAELCSNINKAEVWHSRATAASVCNRLARENGWKVFLLPAKSAVKRAVAITGDHLHATQGE